MVLSIVSVDGVEAFTFWNFTPRILPNLISCIDVDKQSTNFDEDFSKSI